MSRTAPKQPTPVIIRRLALVLLIASGLLVPWIIVLGSTLEGQTQVRMWSSTWVGLDIVEVVGLFVTAMLMLRRNIQVMATAAFTSAAFLLDSWFDVMLSQAGHDWYQALSMAMLLELPLCLICAAVAVTAPRWCKKV